MIVTKAHLLAEYAAGRGPLAEAADDEPVFLLRATDFESQGALWTFANTAHHRWRSRPFVDYVNAVLEAMKRWFTAHNAGMPASAAGQRTVVPSKLGRKVKPWQPRSPR